MTGKELKPSGHWLFSIYWCMHSSLTYYCMIPHGSYVHWIDGFGCKVEYLCTGMDLDSWLARTCSWQVSIPPLSFLSNTHVLSECGVSLPGDWPGRPSPSHLHMAVLATGWGCCMLHNGCLLSGCRKPVYGVSTSTPHCVINCIAGTLWYQSIVIIASLSLQCNLNFDLRIWQIVT